MNKEYISPITEIIVINNGNLLEDDWVSIVLDGTLPGGDTIGPGGDGEEGDIQLSKGNIWEDAFMSKDLWEDD